MSEWNTFDQTKYNQSENDKSFLTTTSDNIFSTTTINSTFTEGTSLKESAETRVNVFKVIEKQNISLDSQ